MSKQNENPQDEPILQKKSKHRLYLAFLGLIIVLLAIPYAYTANPKSCTSCHDMQKYYDSWKNSPHVTAAKNCFDCHVKQGTVSLMIYRIAFYREIYASMVGAKLKPIGATLPPVDSCQRKGCHTLNRMTSESGDLRIDHRGHVLKANIPCIKCHPGAAHPNVGKIGSILPPRKMCKKCHYERMNDCSFCHTKRHVGLDGYKHQ